MMLFLTAQLLYLLLSPACFGHAQEDDPYSLQFQWEFKDRDIFNPLPTCQSLAIRVRSYNTTDNSTSRGTPPYYMLALALRGIPRLYDIGESEDDLSWTSDFPGGTELLLTVLDSNSSVGGISPITRTALHGPSSACIKEQESSDFTVTANVTDTLNTCDPWGITVSGGVPPYRFTFAAPYSTVLTNFTSEGDELDTLTYINRAYPDSQLLVAVSDVSGRYASGTPIVDTAGSQDPTCPDFNTRFGNAQEMAKPQEAAQAAADKRRKKRIAIAVPCAIVGLLLIAGVVLLMRLTKRRKERLLGTDLDARPRTFDQETPTVTEAHLNNDRPLTLSGKSNSGPTDRTTDLPHVAASARGRSQAPSTGAEGDRPQVERSASGELYVQHRDGGVNVVREFPPPYVAPVIPAGQPTT